MKPLTSILRVIVALGLAFIWTQLIPIHTGPFGGCETQGYLTLQSGCTDWPQFLRGFGFVLIAAVVAPSQSRLHYVAIFIIGVVTLVGGFEGLKTGLHFDINNLGDLIGLATWAFPLFIGGLVALLLFLCGKYFVDKYRVNSAA